MKKLLYFMLCLVYAMFYYSCNQPQQQATKRFEHYEPTDFDTNQITIKTDNYRSVKGQLVYMPVYSHIPFNVDTNKHFANMSAFLAVHNTDIKNKIKILKVLYFDTNGKLVYDFLKDKTEMLDPFATVHYYVPFEDDSGIGANFLIEWIADTSVNEPLIESITINVRTNQSAAIMSQGRIIRELK